MARNFRRWIYLLCIAVFLISVTFGFRDFLATLTIISITSMGVTEPLYRKLDSTRQWKWLIPCWIALALAFGGLYYFADLFLFSHSSHAARRVQDACLLGPYWAFFGLLTAYWSPGNKREPVPASN